jgi:phospholipase C
VKTPHSARRRRLALATCLASLSLTTIAASVRTPAANADGAVPRLDHVVIVVMENKDYDDIVGRPDEAPFIDAMAHQSANFTNSFAITHPSQPNYIAMFSGSTQGVTNDDCTHLFRNLPNLGTDLIAAGLSFTGYSEGLSADGSSDCDAGGDLGYARKHNPWAQFDNVPRASNRTFDAWPSSDYTQLPTVSFLVPNLCHDMHSCSRDEGDAWAESVLYPYAHWAIHNNSLLIITFDEDDDNNNHIPTMMYGGHVKAGYNGEAVDHYRVLRTIEEMYGLPARGEAANRDPITDMWN